MQVSAERFSEVLELASKAGHILLQNGAEISRVEDIMARMASYFGVSSGNFFVLSNGIFTTGRANKVRQGGGQASTYANVEFIPIRSVQLAKVRAVNRLSYDISAGKCTLDEAQVRLAAIDKIPVKPVWEQVLASAFGAGGFCAVFGGGFLDCAAAFCVGLVLYLFLLLVSARNLSKIVGGICNALVASALCIVSWRVGFGVSLGNMIIGAVMPLIPGVPFVNGVRDLANSDYLAGLTRMTDALLGFFCIALGVSLAFILDGTLHQGVIPLEGMWTNPETAGYGWQALAAFLGTVAFACLYGVDRDQYLLTGLVGIVGWMVYLLVLRQGGQSPAISATAACLVVGVLSRFLAVWTHCPAQLYLLCGLFTLVPGGGIFWCIYYLTSGQMALASQSGFAALKVAVSIVLGIILAMEIPQRVFSKRILPH